ncbi:MAG: VOC family protein [Planctomycetia bacterium]|nr:VOC family protein [Planctomycetia bacterium]
MATIEHFAIYAADAPALKDFYTRAFDLEVVLESVGDPPGYFLADDRGTAIEIIGRPPGQTGANQRWVCHLAFWVDDFPASHSTLERRGVRFEADTFVDNDAFKTAFFNDPEGNRLQIVWRRSRLGS